MKKVCALLGMLLLTTSSYAEVYKWKDSEGRIHYSDRPVQGAEVVKSIPLTTYNPPPVRSRSPGAAQKEQEKSISYAQFAFVSPANNTTVRDNAGNIAVQISLDPPLRQGHSISLTIDGKPLKNPLQATTFTLSNVDRGTHTLQATVVDGEGNILAEAPATTVHMQRKSILSPNATKNNP